MTDRAREGLFSSIASWVPKADVLDLFAGSGSLGLEALSRGAASATFVERDRLAVDALRANIEIVGLGGRVVARAVEPFLASEPGHYDLVFVDPPYAMSFGEIAAIMGAVVPRLRPGGLVILHRRAGEDRPVVPGLAGAGERAYGTAQLWRYERADVPVSDVMDDGDARQAATRPLGSVAETERAAAPPTSLESAPQEPTTERPAAERPTADDPADERDRA